MTVVSRLYAGLAAFALVCAGLAVVAPTPAQAQDRKTTSALIAGGVVVAVVLGAVVLADNDDGEDESPQSP